MIWGYHYFRKHPYMYVCNMIILSSCRNDMNLKMQKAMRLWFVLIGGEIFHDLFLRHHIVLPRPTSESASKVKIIMKLFHLHHLHHHLHGCHHGVLIALHQDTTSLSAIACPHPQGSSASKCVTNPPRLLPSTVSSRKQDEEVWLR